MAQFQIDNNKVILSLTKHRGKVRIADGNGNHKSKTLECLISPDLFVEWMITNTEIQELISKFLDLNDKSRLKTQIEEIRDFVKTSQYAERQAVRANYVEEFHDFRIYKYTESFYSFELINANSVINKIIFKMGDYTLAPHFFLLIPFNHSNLKFMNKMTSELEFNTCLGSGAKGVWEIEKSDIENLIKTISSASQDHKNDMLRFLS